MPNHIHEQRRHFRLEETVLLSFQVLERYHLDEELLALPPRVADHIIYPEHVSNRAIELAKDSLQQAASEVQILWQDPQQKGEGQEGLVVRDRQFAAQPLAVSLSACGIAFPVYEYYGKETKLALEITLLPNCQKIICYCSVIDCHLQSLTPRFLLRANFDVISAHDEMVLMQYMERRFQESMLAEKRRA